MKRTTLIQLITLPIFIAILVYMFYLTYVENFQIGTRYECPSRNQNFDLRGDIPIERHDWPALNSSIGPMQPSACSFRQSIFAS